ncbi:hypothetical protein [Nocardia sp. NPDC049707]|uniref:TRADD-N-associated membrane domain-containing protein n=1 Tax=Nocardia sp. NPDC049707 TaxID=3154735 RepID=UPI0034382810
MADIEPTDGVASLDARRADYEAELARFEKKRDELVDEHRRRSLMLAQDARAVIKKSKLTRRFGLVFTLFLALATLVLSWVAGSILGFFAVVIMVSMAAFQWVRGSELVLDGEAVLAKLEVYAALEEIKGPDDLLGLLKLNRRQMDAYDVAARRQGNASHWASLAAMTVGLGIVGLGLWIAVTAETDAAKYSAAIIAGVATAAGSYIARTFIHVHSTTQEQVRFYFEQPLVQSYMLMAERFIAQMPESERPAQFVKLVDSAASQAAMVPLRRVGAQPIPELPPTPASDTITADDDRRSNR